jgi:hypothetical protein
MNKLFLNYFSGKISTGTVDPISFLKEFEKRSPCSNSFKFKKKFSFNNLF